MADFIQTSNTKAAVRVLSTPIADISTFDGIIQAVMDDNPFGCSAYEDGGETIPGVARSREYYTAKIVYETVDAEKVGAVSAQAPTVTAFGDAASVFYTRQAQVVPQDPQQRRPRIHIDLPFCPVHM